MSEAQYTGFQFYDDPEFPIDPRLLDNHQTQGNHHLDCTQFNDFNDAPSTQEFDFDVEQAVQSQSSQLQSFDPLETLPTTPTNLSPRTSSLNPRALPFRPQQFPDTLPRNSSDGHFGHQHPSGAPVVPYQHAEGNHALRCALLAGRERGPGPSTPSHRRSLMGRLNTEDMPASQTPVAPRRLYASVLGTQDANLSPGGRMLAYEAAPDGSWSQPDPNSVTTNAISSANVARLPMEPNTFGQMYQWNQDTYQGPALQSPYTQFPPTPSASGRGRSGRGGSVSTQAGNHRCDVCQKTLSTRHELNHHKRWHEKGFACELCDKVFSAAKDLRRHFAAKHNRAERHLFCNILGCKFRQKGFHRLDHLKRHHERKHSEYPWSPPATSSFGGG